MARSVQLNSGRLPWLGKLMSQLPRLGQDWAAAPLDGGKPTSAPNRATKFKLNTCETSDLGCPEDGSGIQMKPFPFCGELFPMDVGSKLHECVLPKGILRR